MDGGEADGPRGGRRACTPHGAADWGARPRSCPGIRLRRPGAPRTFVGYISLIFSWLVRWLSTFGSPWYLSFSRRTGPGGAPAPGLVGQNPFLGHPLLSLGALRLPNASGPSPAGEGCFGGRPGTAPGGAGEAFSPLSRLPRCPRRLGGASPPGGLGRRASGRAPRLAQPWGGRPLRAQGQAGLVRPQPGRGGRCVNPGLGSSSRHRDGGGVVRAAGRVHTGRPVHGQRGWRQGYCAAERMGTVRPCPREGALDSDRKSVV